MVIARCFIMKYYIRVLLVLVTSFVVFGCVRVNINESTLKTFDSFIATIEPSDLSKTVVEESGAVSWELGDCIGVFSDAQSPVPYYLDDDGKFRGEPISGTTFYAYYPYSDFIYDEENPTVLQTELFFASYNTKRIKMRMVAKSTGNELAFKHTTGNLRFKIRSPFNLGITYRANNEENKICGKGYVDLKQDNPIFVLDPEKWTEFYYRVDPENGIPDNGEWVFDLPLPPTTLSEGFRLDIDYYPNGVDRQRYVKSYKKPFTIGRGQMKTFVLVDLEGELEENEQAILSDRAALVALYDALDGAHWVDNTNWCTDKPLNQWSGIYTNQNGRVVIIQFQHNNNLSGELPEVFDALSELEILTIYGNEGLVGNIPESLGTCSNLETLIISGCQIEGAIPESLGNCTRLEHLAINNCPISGSIPASFRNLSRLRVLSIAHTPLKEIKTSDNRLTGESPRWLDELSSLEVLDLTDNLLSGELMVDFTKLSNLTELSLGYNSFSGPLPSLDGLNLSRVELNSNLFSGSIPGSYADLMNHIPWATQLFLGENNLTGPIPEQILQSSLFAEFAASFIAAQRDGYGLTFDDTKIPASRRTYKTLSGEEVNLAEIYAKNKYTMLYMWDESMPFAVSGPHTLKKYMNDGLYAIGIKLDLYENYSQYNIIPTSYMQDTGLDQWQYHICNYGSNGLCVWPDFWIPFVEIVDQEGNIVFMCNSVYAQESYSYLSFTHSANDLDAFLDNLFADSRYSSNDYTADGLVYTLQESSSGNGIDVVLMGDGFTDLQIADGTYRHWMQRAADILFSEEPYKTYKDLFNLYYVNVVSKNEYPGDTALDVVFGEGTHVGGNLNSVIEYANHAVNDSRIDDALVLVLINRDYYAGTCHYFSVPENGDYGRGLSVAYFPIYSDRYTFAGMVNHEAGGHGFAKLADEYVNQPGVIPDDVKATRQTREEFGWWKNVDFTNNPSEVKWSQFLSDERYAGENLGCYEGGFTYSNGVWHSTEDSIMNHNTGGFNAPSRYAIWYRINKLAFGADYFDGKTPEEIYEEFVTFDLSTRPSQTPAATATTKHRSYVEKPFVPLAPPVIHEGSWRDIR